MPAHPRRSSLAASRCVRWQAKDRLGSCAPHAFLPPANHGAQHLRCLLGTKGVVSTALALHTSPNTFTLDRWVQLAAVSSSHLCGRQHLGRDISVAFIVPMRYVPSNC